ncbi:uncharacterized protein EI97DRAFT_444442 [Westerdykella ornata]|uniref:Uncharacterized protein n=1 Tax=Westerdykella ornata TaxID=318751 RepID=A0A6A6JFC2_WESOR|nr:uncharacterized protein EI97DRAFT_444442 [Westerdykella ornata]KAF2273879.1 hypothetical protein EI97DRAFT_444442 [Westerdykella ornata]
MTAESIPLFSPRRDIVEALSRSKEIGGTEVHAESISSLDFDRRRSRRHSNFGEAKLAKYGNHDTGVPSSTTPGQRMTMAHSTMGQIHNLCYWQLLLYLHNRRSGITTELEQTTIFFRLTVRQVPMSTQPTPPPSSSRSGHWEQSNNKTLNTTLSNTITDPVTAELRPLTPSTSPTPPANPLTAAATSAASTVKDISSSAAETVKSATESVVSAVQGAAEWVEEKAEKLAGEESEAAKGLGPYGNPGTAVNSDLDPLSGGAWLLPVIEAERAAAGEGAKDEENEENSEEKQSKKDK